MSNKNIKIILIIFGIILFALIGFLLIRQSWVNSEPPKNSLDTLTPEEQQEIIDRFSSPPMNIDPGDSRFDSSANARDNTNKVEKGSREYLRLIENTTVKNSN